MEGAPVIDQNRQHQAKNYAHQRRILNLAELAIMVAYLFALLITGASLRLRDLATAAFGEFFLVVAAYFLIFYIGYVLLSLPFAYYGGYVVAHRFQLSTQSISAWLSDWVKSTGLSFLLGLFLIEILYWLLRMFPGTWWIPAGVGVVLFSIILANLAPILIVPLFYKLRPLNNDELESRLIELAERAGTRVRGVFTMNMSSKTTAANAALMGLGNTRRIVLGDTLIEKFTTDEIETVMAHELGHHVHHDIAKLILTESITTFVALFIVSIVLRWTTDTFGFRSVADVAALPILALTIGAVNAAFTPLTNGLSRRYERQADRYALETSREPRAFAHAMIRLANQNLAELRPAEWAVLLLYTHPPVGERIDMAERFAQNHRH